MSQTSVSLYQPAAFNGMLADLSRRNDAMSYAAQAATPFGSFVALGTNKEKQVTPLTTSVGQGALAVGVAIASHTVEQSSAGVAQYAIGDTVPVLKSGRFWVVTDDAVVAGAVANLKLSSGKVTDEAVAAGIEAFTQFSARFITGTSGSALALVEIK
jgi:hypothetical protein